MAMRTTERHWALAPPDLAARMRLGVRRVGDALLTCAATSDALRLNRVIGLGSRRPVTAATIDAIVEFYREAGVRRFSVMLSPGPGAGATARMLLRRGFVRHGGHELLVRDARRPVPPGADVRVARARRGEAGIVLRIHERVFGGAPSHRSWGHASLVGGGSEHYLARIGATPVGAGALDVDGTLAWLGGGATLTRWRRRGVHAALIAARLRRAARRRCRWVWVETAVPAPGRPSGSHRNLLKMGFVVAGARPRFVWTMAGAGRDRRPRHRSVDGGPVRP